MTYFDVFNGDADGICALHQMRLKHPVQSTLITGIKRDIQLVRQVKANQGDKILILDISLAKNQDAVMALLEQGCAVQYFDHHLKGEPFTHNLFEQNINISPEICTSLLMNEHLKGEHVLWAIVGAYGDNMFTAANALVEKNGLNKMEQIQLKELGQYINYNSYGSSLDDLHFKPADLYTLIKPYANPFEFIKNEPAFITLQVGYNKDIEKAESLLPTQTTEKTAVYSLPNEKWAKRVSGVFGNQLATKHPNRAHTLLTDIGNNNFQVSVRAPQKNKIGAGKLCAKFKTGGGREGAAGINCLKGEDKKKFLKLFTKQYS